MDNSVLDNVTWEGNSKKMYKTILEAVPSLFKGTVKQEVKSWVTKNSVKVITEDLVIKFFKEKAPKSMWQKLAPKLEEMKTQKK